MNKAARLAGLSIFILMTASGLALPAGAQNPPGVIHLRVNLTRAPQKILHAEMAMPAHPGPLTLYYPQWIPGEHAPDGPITDLAGLKFSAGGKAIPWRRDLTDMFAFHLEVPEGANSIEAQFDFLLAAPASGFSAGASATEQLDLVSWNQVLLYPMGWPVSELTYAPSVELPKDWQFATALHVQKKSGSTIEFEPVRLDRLVDSPVLAGRFFRVIQLTPGQKPANEIDIAADSEAALEMPPEMQMQYKQLVAETGALFGSRHYREYHFLLSLSDDVAHFGLEHHESSDDRAAERSLVDDTLRIEMAGLLPHEFVHSWNGKYRRPADLATPDFQQPMKDDLLWVYEGLTQYLGEILTARSGLLNEQQFRENLAYIAATYEHRPGRNWRPLQDTADAAQLLYFARGEWENYRRSTDYYDEGTLIWLEVDTTIRRLTGDKKSMNDFCRIFHGGPGGEPALKTYTFDDVVAALTSVAPYDWAGFLTKRLATTEPHAPLAGIENSGWKLVYNETPNEIQQAREEARQEMDLTSSLGFVVQEDGTLRDVVYDGPAYKAGIGPGMKLAGVNGQQFSADALQDVLEASTSSDAPITVLVMNGAYFRTFPIDYHGGMRYPHLERVNGRPDLLGEIIRPLAGAVKAPPASPTQRTTATR